MEHIITITKQNDKYVALIKCPLCGHITTLTLSEEQGQSIKKWITKGGLITNYLQVVDDKTKVIKDLLVDGICADCLNKRGKKVWLD